MLIECLIKREGPTHINVAGFDYVFEKNKEGRSVCDVISSGHQAHFLELGSFVPYERGETKKTEVDSLEEPDEQEDIAARPIEAFKEVDVLYRHDGMPYSTEKAARVAIKQRSLDEDLAEVIAAEGGYAIQLERQGDDE